MGHALCGRLRREVPGEDGPVVILFLGCRSVDRESLVGKGELGIADFLIGKLLQGVDP